MRSQRHPLNCLLLRFQNNTSCPFLHETTSNEAQTQSEVPLESGIWAVPLHTSFLVQTLLCMIFPDLSCVCFSSLFTATLPGQLAFDFPYWDSKYTLWRKWGRKRVVANHSRLSKDLYYKSRFYFHFQPRHLWLKSMSKATGMTGFFSSSWHIIFHLSNVFPLPASQPQPIHPVPGFTILGEIENGWRGTERLIGSIDLSIEDGL